MLCVMIFTTNTHPHETIYEHHPAGVKGLLYETSHKRKVLANVSLRTVWYPQAQELDSQSLPEPLSLFLG